jgi:tRNA pseudouridine32 synthase/23S rRNA pseudouridine746 synthase
MTVLHSLIDFGICDEQAYPGEATYWYEGQDIQTGEGLCLPRTPLVEAIARGLMQQLAQMQTGESEGKMYGVLLVELPGGEHRVLQAFSGLLQGCRELPGWVPPIPGREVVAFDEAQTLVALDRMKAELLSLAARPEWQEYKTLKAMFDKRLQDLATLHRDRKHQRQYQREQFTATRTGEELARELHRLEEESRRDGRERRQLKQERDSRLASFEVAIAQLEHQIRDLKQQRKTLSRQLQTQMHAHYSLTNFLGTSASLRQLMPSGAPPTGTGDCCAPKLLHYAATHHLKPLALAEFWWGSSSRQGDRIPGEFYGACAERCQPMMGFLLTGLPRFSSPRPSFPPLPILYEDNWLIAVEKPDGLLSVPGRTGDRQESVLYRLQQEQYGGESLFPVHRLDQATSGILLLARDRPTHALLSRQFQQREVQKTYEAVLAGLLTADAGTIHLPLWGDPGDRPRQAVNWHQGKPSTTHFQVLDRAGGHTRVRLIPVTGRTHQLRVHAASPEGLAIPILGDRLYGCQASAQRLHLHAKTLCFLHPQSGESIHLQSSVPF